LTPQDASSSAIRLAISGVFSVTTLSYQNEMT